jgi:hypothetical protein
MAENGIAVTVDHHHDPRASLQRRPNKSQINSVRHGLGYVRFIPPPLSRLQLGTAAVSSLARLIRSIVGFR